MKKLDFSKYESFFEDPSNLNAVGDFFGIKDVAFQLDWSGAWQVALPQFTYVPIDYLKKSELVKILFYKII